MTVGNAVKIISVLLNEAFPDKQLDSQNLIKNLKALNTKLNPLSHHPPVEIDTMTLVDEISNILNHSMEIVFEMPWHFYPVQRYGHQPIVLTGDAWSHSNKHNRQLSIIIWSDNNISEKEKMLVWNPTKENPIIPDGIVINRP
ncbi:MAG: hypothetical protein FJY17_10800 [Bacteroidetes bacterium]|nr:hypothetical protein [Bacteroidota bacterium]